jgi:hypothetical protein
MQRTGRLTKENKMSDNACEQAKAQANSIAAMVAALNVDYDRLEELKDERDNLRDDCADIEKSDNEHVEACKALTDWLQSHEDELRELEETANGCESEDEAREAIHNDPLDVQVRSDWYNPCSKGEGDSPSEFYILLCTGGPACRIMGELNDYCEPCRAWIEFQDWGTSWTEAPGIISQDVLLQYCQQFYFGE